MTIESIKPDRISFNINTSTCNEVKENLNKTDAAGKKAFASKAKSRKASSHLPLAATLKLNKKLKTLSIKIHQFAVQTAKKRKKSAKKTAASTKQVALANLEFLAKGKEKRVYQEKDIFIQNAIYKSDTSKKETVDEMSKAYYTPVKTFYASKEKSLRAEKKIQDTVNNRLNKQPKYLATQAEEIEIDGKFGLEVPKASGDFEDKVREDLSLTERITFGHEYILGMTELHDANFAYGDIKPENCLIFDDTLKIGDFGKTRDVGHDATLYSGNLRFAPPEGTLSQKGDVWGAAIVLIRNFEEVLLQQKDKESLLEVKDKEKFTPAEKRRGVEKFILEHKAFQAIEPNGWKGKISAIKRRFKLMNLTDKEKLHQGETLNEYINILGNELLDYDQTEININQLITLLKDMTKIDPDKRPTMFEVKLRYESMVMRTYTSSQK